MLAWVLIALGLLNSIFQFWLCIWAGHRIGHSVLAIVWLTLPILGVVFYLFVYWDVNPDYLIARKFWKVRRISWQSVRSVGKLGVFADNVKINYGHSIEDYGNVVAYPANRAEFVVALRRLAPLAEFKE
jgi:hypothetical protein